MRMLPGLLLATTVAFAQVGTPTIASVVQALRAHNNARALRLSRELARVHAADPRVWTLQGIALEGLGRTRESLQALDHALEIDPNNIAALEAAVQIQFQAHSPKAERLLKRLARLDPQNETTHAMLAAIAFNQKNCSESVKEFQRATHVISDNLPALGEFGTCLFQLENYKDAVQVLQRILVLEPHDWHSSYNLGLAQFHAQQYEEAIETLLPLTQGSESKVEALNLIAAVYEANQQTPDAVAALQRAIALAPNEVNNYLDLATISLDHGAYKVGVDVVNAGLRVHPRSAALYLERGILEVQFDHFEEADADFDKAEALNPVQNNSPVALGISLIQQNKLDRSLSVVKQRLAKAPDDPVLNYLLAEVYIRKGVEPGTPAFQEATAAAQRALAKKPDFALAADVLTELYLRSGQTRLAEEASRRALKSDPNDQAAIYHLIICLRRREGSREEVAQLRQRLAKITSMQRQEREARNRFKLVEAGVASPSPRDRE